MRYGRFIRSALIFAALALPVSTAVAQPWYVFADTLDCTGRTVGKNVVKLNCYATARRANRIYTLTPSFTIRGPVARKYLGRHEGCRYVPASETRSNQHFVDCPGIAKWF